MPRDLRLVSVIDPGGYLRLLYPTAFDRTVLLLPVPASYQVQGVKGAALFA